MRIQCGGCGARYSVADARLAAKVVKVRCNRCDEVIVVTGRVGSPVTGGGRPDRADRATGARGDGSVLFTLDALRAGATGPASASGLLSSTPPTRGGAGVATADGSGLIDIRMLAAATRARAGDEDARAPGLPPQSASPRFGPLGACASPLVTPSPGRTSGDRALALTAGLVGGGVLIAAAIVVAAIIIGPAPATPAGRVAVRSTTPSVGVSRVGGEDDSRTPETAPQTAPSATQPSPMAIPVEAKPAAQRPQRTRGASPRKSKRRRTVTDRGAHTPATTSPASRHAPPHASAAARGDRRTDRGLEELMDAALAQPRRPSPRGDPPRGAAPGDAPMPQTR